MKYILVIIMTASPSLPVAVGTAEFDDRAACIAASNHIRKIFVAGYAYCYPKASPKKLER